MKETLVWAHRGASGYAPENTLGAFEKAVELGADGIELDVQMTKDGELVVIHDETIDRVCEGTGWVKDYSYAKLSRFNFNKTQPAYAHEQIPALEEVYELIKPTNLTINVEIKTGIVFYPDIEERVLELTARMGMEDRVLYSSFNHYTVRRIKELLPEAKTGVLYSDGIINPASYCAYVTGADAVHPALYNLQYPGFMEECRKHNLKVHVWTVNEEMHMRRVCERQVDAMITNYPDLGKKIVQEYENGELVPELVRAVKDVAKL
ncbi:MAG: glycerophosphodiester phosphodiesterase [Roseburia sp.]